MASWHGSLRASLQPVILKNLYPPVVGIDDIHPIVTVDENACRELELAECRPASPEEIQQLPFAIEHLHCSRESLDQVNVVLRVNADSLGPKQRVFGIADVSNRAL